MAYRNPTEGTLADRLSPKQIAKRLGACEATVYAMLRRGDIPSIKIGRRWRVGPGVFEAWLAGQPVGLMPTPVAASSEASPPECTCQSHFAATGEHADGCPPKKED